MAGAGDGHCLMAVVARSEKFRGLFVASLRILGVAVIYYAGTRIGTLEGVVRVEGAAVSPLWPPTGIALTCLFLMGPGIWPGITLGVLFHLLTLDPLSAVSPGVMAGCTLAPLCSYLLLRRVGFRIELDRPRDGLALVFLGALAGMLISATVGTSMLVLHGRLPVGFWPTWLAWWAGDAMGVLLVTPFLLVVCRIRRPLRLDRWVEGTAVVVAAAIITPLAVRMSLTLVFLFFPVLIWAALRFQLAGSAPYALFVSVMTVLETTEREGAFAHHTLTERLISLQVLNGSVALTSLLVAAVVTEQRNVRVKIEQACEALAEVVERLAPAEMARLRPPEREGESG
ncbi:MASE1 domain-containing protein [Streptomyces sp. NPDC102274]|uniref:MASE1 domain-containing protein n=1 Tax=Streptomyces sp. NPDC102274 TaxID=3366151 RepID=UPI00380BA0B2